MSELHKFGDIWINDDDPFERLITLIFVFLSLLIMGVLLYFGFLLLYQKQFNWGSCVLFTTIFSVLGMFYTYHK